MARVCYLWFPRFRLFVSSFGAVRSQWGSWLRPGGILSAMFKTRMTFEQSEQGWLKSLTDGMLLFQQLNGAGCREPKRWQSGMQGLTRGWFKRLVISSHALLSFGHLVVSTVFSKYKGMTLANAGRCRQSLQKLHRDPIVHPPQVVDNRPGMPGNDDLPGVHKLHQAPATSCDGSRQRISGNHSFSIGIRRLPVANASGGTENFRCMVKGNEEFDGVCKNPNGSNGFSQFSIV